MAKRHEDRKPGQRFSRGDAGNSQQKSSPKPQRRTPKQEPTSSPKSDRKPDGKPGGKPAGKAPYKPDRKPTRGVWSGSGKPTDGKPTGGKPTGGKPTGGKPTGGKPTDGKPSGGKPGSTRTGATSSRPPGVRPAPGKARPVGGSKRRATGIVVTPSDVLGPKAGKGAARESAAKDGKVRLNHYLAMSGIASRRHADELIQTGRVEINGEIVTELGVRVDPTVDDVRFDGTRLQAEKSVYVLFNKPKGIVCTNAPNEQKKRVIDLLPTIRGRIFTVGRLDMDSEGLLLVTNDGEFAQEMTHPSYGIAKLYSVMLRGRVDESVLGKARGGVWLAEGPTEGMQLRIERLTKERSYLKVTLREGKNREIRRVFARLGYPVISLKRVRIGNLNLHGLGDGDFRFLRVDEVAMLRKLSRGEVIEEVEPKRTTTHRRSSSSSNRPPRPRRNGGMRR